MNIKMPALEAQLIDIDKIYGNNYNPNVVAKPELELLERSIVNNGFCFPIVVIKDENEKYCIVDGFHRYMVAKKLKLQAIPAVILACDITKRMSATIQFNRARGTHQILDMSKVIVRLIEEGKSDDEIAVDLGMDRDEILRLKQVSGLKSAFQNEEFSKSWEEFSKKYDI